VFIFGKGGVMRIFLALIVIFCFLVVPVSTFAEKKGTKGASQKAIGNASDEAVFNRVGDWFATIGKSDQEKEKILVERKVIRAKKKAKKKAEKAAAKAEKKMKEAKESFSGGK
jgi:hypothetical protein